MHTEIIKYVIVAAMLLALAAIAISQNENLVFEDEEEESPICEYCLGTGWVSAMEMVEAGNPATMADVGEQRCECNIREDFIE